MYPPRVLRRLSPAAIAIWLAWSAPAAADRPTSSDLAILGGRTMGVDQTALAGAVGWPGIWAAYFVAPSSTFNLGFRATVLYGSPYLGLGTGVGAEVAVPLRFHLHGEDIYDLVLELDPGLVIGEPTLAGEPVGFSDDVALGAALGATLLGAARISDVVTLTGGLGAAGAVAGTTSRDAQPLGLFHARLAIEALMDRDTMMFGELRVGYGLAKANTFDGHEVVRASLGIAYLL